MLLSDLEYCPMEQVGVLEHGGPKAGTCLACVGSHLAGTAMPFDEAEHLFLCFMHGYRTFSAFLCETAFAVGFLHANKVSCRRSNLNMDASARRPTKTRCTKNRYNYWSRYDVLHSIRSCWKGRHRSDGCAGLGPAPCSLLCSPDSLAALIMRQVP